MVCLLLSETCVCIKAWAQASQGPLAARASASKNIEARLFLAEARLLWQITLSHVLPTGLAKITLELMEV